MKDKDNKKKVKFKKVRFGTRNFLHRSGLAAMSCTFENYEPGKWTGPSDVYFSISNGVDQEVTLYDFKDIKKLSAMLSTFVTQVEAVK